MTYQGRQYEILSKSGGFGQRDLLLAEKLLDAMEQKNSLMAALTALAEQAAHEHEHEHHHGHEHEHHHEGHHHADEVFTSWGMESPRKFTEAEIAFCLNALDSGSYGSVLRAKGIVPAPDGTWLHFDYVPGEQEIRTGAADYTGRLCVIGAQLNESALRALFGGEARA